MAANSLQELSLSGVTHVPKVPPIYLINSVHAYSFQPNRGGRTPRGYNNAGRAQFPRTRIGIVRKKCSLHRGFCTLGLFIFLSNYMVRFCPYHLNKIITLSLLEVFFYVGMYAGDV